MKPNILLAFALADEQIQIDCSEFEIHSVITGITKPYAAARLAKAVEVYHPDIIINIGSAGTMNRSVGDIIVSTHFVDRDIAKQSFESVSSTVQTTCRLKNELPSLISDKELFEDLKVNTGDDFVTETVDFVGDAIDMEAFADAIVAKEFGVEFIAVKYITDKVGENSMQIWQEKLSDARNQLTAYFKKYLK